MSSKKVFKVKDKVFAKIRGYPAWPALVSGVKADTPSRLRYNVYFYGTGERAECKPEELFPYEENKAKLGKPSKRKYFTEALLQIEDAANESVLPENDTHVITTPSNVEYESTTVEPENVGETENVGESNSESEGKLSNEESTSSKGKKSIGPRKSLGLSMSKGTKRKISDVKPEAPSKKSMINKQKLSVDTMKFNESRAIVLVEALNDSFIEKATNSQQKSENLNKKVNVDGQNSKTTDKNAATLNITTEPEPETNDVVLLENSKISKSFSKLKDSPSSSEISSSNSSNVGHVSRSGRKIKPKKYSDYENDAEVPKRARLSKENSKTSEKYNNGSNETDTSSEQNYKTKENSETKKTPKSHRPASESHDTITQEFSQVSKKIGEDEELPVELKDLMTGALSNIETGWKKTGSKKVSKVEILHTEVDLLDYIYKLRLALRTDNADYEAALELLERISELQMNALMLKKHQEIVDTIKKVTKYIGNANEWNLSDQEIIEHTEKATQVRRKAETVFNKLVSYFFVPQGETFQDIYDKEVSDFFDKTKNMDCSQIYGLTSDKQLK